MTETRGTLLGLETVVFIPQRASKHAWTKPGCLVDLIYLVGLAYLVHVVYFVRRTKNTRETGQTVRARMNKQTSEDLTERRIRRTIRYRRRVCGRVSWQYRTMDTAISFASRSVLTMPRGIVLESRLLLRQRRADSFGYRFEGTRKRRAPRRFRNGGMGDQKPIVIFQLITEYRERP